jgi:hypothetical protein
MLITFFRKSFLPQYILLVLIIGLLWTGNFLKPSGLLTGTDSLLQPAYNLLLKGILSNELAGKIIAIVLILAEAFLFNQILIKYELVPKNTLIPALVFLTLMSHSDQLLILNPALISGFLLLFVLHFLFQIYTEEEAYSQIFNAGFLTGIASFIYFPSILFLIFIWLTFIVYRLYKWREWIIPVAGLAIPYIYLLTYFFWFDKLEIIMGAYMGYFTGLWPVKFHYEPTLIDLVISGIILFLFFWSFLKLAADIQERNISVRKRFWSVFWFFFIAVIVYIVTGVHDITCRSLLIIPVSLYISSGFSQLRKKFWIEFLFTVLLILIIINNFKEVLFK